MPALGGTQAPFAGDLPGFHPQAVALELEEKFNLPMQVLDAKGYRQARRGGEAPLSADAIVVMSHHYVNRLREELKIIAWDLVVIDEAHKLRNAYRPSNKVGKGIRWATEDNGMVFPPRRRSWTPRIRSRPCGDRRGRRSRSPTSTRFRRKSGGSSASSAVSARRSSRSRTRSSRSATSSSTR